MVSITRRDYVRASTAAGVALGLKASGLLGLEKAWAASTSPPVLWLQAQSCSGCSVSLLNTINYATIDQLLLDIIDLTYHPTIMAAAGDLAVSAAETAYSNGGYVLVVEGAIPTAARGQYCYLWPGLTALDGVKAFAENAAAVLAVGTCAAFGGMAAGKPNPTESKGVGDILHKRIPVVNIPGCPAHPDWIVGTVAHLIEYGTPPPLDSMGRPSDYFGTKVHVNCPNKSSRKWKKASVLSEEGCLSNLGCRGQQTLADCPLRGWNSGVPGEPPGEHGVNWCVGARSPCHGCTEPDFPDGMTPFFTLGKRRSKSGKAASAGEPQTRKGVLA